MSEALEHVIAEQQKEIDRLRLMEKNNNERWQHENKSVERMALAAFSVLQTEQNASFACEWALPEFKFNESGFLIAENHEAPFTCKYCGSPSWIDPSDQLPPPDYCHEIDHGTEEDRAAV